MTRSVRIRLHVVPGATRAGVVGRHGDGWKVRVAAPAEGGAANRAVVRLLADTTGLRARDDTLVAGHAARDKIAELVGITRSELENRLASVERKDLRR